jgi:fibronectin-binding autotransporter adhesin
MKNKNFLLFSSLITLASLAGSASAQVTKADNSTTLNLAGAYVGGVPPTSSDLFIIDSTLTAARSSALVSDLSVLGITSSSALAFTFANTAAKTLTIGASGISITGAGILTLASSVNLGSAQTWALNNRRLDLTGALTTNGNALSITGAAGSTLRTNTNTFGTDVTIGNNVGVVLNAGTLTITGINNTNASFTTFSGTTHIASMGNLGDASSIGTGRASATGVINYTGSTFSSNKGLDRQNGGTLALNVNTVGQTLSMSGNFTSRLTSHIGGFSFGGAGNLSLSGNILNATATTVTKNGTGTLTLSGANAYTGATSVESGTLALVGGSQVSPITVNSGATLGFTLGSPTTSTNTLTFSGLTAKVTVTGTPVAATLFTTTVSGGITGTPVLDPAIPGFALQVTATQLNLVASGSTPYDTWAALYLPADVSSPVGDNDNDGLLNQQEFAYGLNPVSGSSVDPIRVPLNMSTATFTYQRRANSGLTYSILKSTTLAAGSWSLAGASQAAGVVDANGNQTVLVTLPGAPLTEAKLFVRVSAE